eukprot:523528-Pleurochrysis_carterae.AAC.1
MFDWKCSDWAGFDCRSGGYGIDTAECIERLVYSCPESCRDVQPYCVPPSPPPLKPYPPSRPMPPRLPPSPPYAPSPCPSPPPLPPRRPRCTDDPNYQDGSPQQQWTCTDWAGFSCRNGGWGIETAEQIELLVYSCPESCGDVE